MGQIPPETSDGHGPRIRALIRGPMHPPTRQGLWHEAGRSAAGPVHWPLCPAPLPPFVGGLGFAVAGPARAKSPVVATTTTMVRARMRISIIPPFAHPRAVLNHKYAGPDRLDILRVG